MKSLDRHIALLNHDSWEIDKKLQEKNYEIERLEKELKREQDNSLYLEEIIDKAIEYIDTSKFVEYKTLKEILRGEDNE